jgi:hypothetical protein
LEARVDPGWTAVFGGLASATLKFEKAKNRRKRRETNTHIHVNISIITFLLTYVYLEMGRMLGWVRGSYLAALWAEEMILQLKRKKYLYDMVP